MHTHGRSSLQCVGHILGVRLWQQMGEMPHQLLHYTLWKLHTQGGDSPHGVGHFLGLCLLQLACLQELWQQQLDCIWVAQAPT